MSLDVFQPLCIATLLVAYGFSLAGAPSARRRAAEIAVIGLTAWAAEESCIRLYAFYGYADGWWAVVGRVPLLVPLIWPMVIFSARAIADALWPEESGFSRSLLVGALVIFDASLMEVIAVAAGYWSWFEPGYFDVPAMGIVGWGCLGLTASAWLDYAAARPRSTLRLAALPFAVVPLTHGMLLAIWWGALRWMLRGDLGPRALLGFAALSAALTLAIALTRRRLGWQTALPRILASLVFFALLATADKPLLWAHVALVAVPHLLATHRPLPRQRRVPFNRAGV